MANVDFSSLT